jgi:3-oxoacyl-[acyl-carrier-protein] synthase II
VSGRVTDRTAEPRIVVTGLGAVTPIGLGVTEFWAGLEAGQNGIGAVTRFDTAEFRSKPR